MIYVECKPDKVLIHTLVNISSKDIEHCAGKSGVCNKLKLKENSVGIIDKDPGSKPPPYLREFELKDKKFSLELYLDRERRNKIIIISPRLEDWILEIAKEEGINLSDYKLPEAPDEFHNVVNANITKFQQLLHHLIKKENKRILTLKEFILSTDLK